MADETLDVLEAIRDDLYNIAILQNPGIAMGGTPNPATLKKVQIPFSAAPSAAQVIFTNSSGRAMLLNMRAVADDGTDVTLLYGSVGNDSLNLLSAPGVAFGRLINQAVLLQPNSTLRIATVSPTGNVDVLVTRIALKGAEPFVDPAPDDDVDE